MVLIGTWGISSSFDSNVGSASGYCSSVSTTGGAFGGGNKGGKLSLSERGDLIIVWPNTRTVLVLSLSHGLWLSAVSGPCLMHSVKLNVCGVCNAPSTDCWLLLRRLDSPSSRVSPDIENLAILVSSASACSSRDTALSSYLQTLRSSLTAAVNPSSFFLSTKNSLLVASKLICTELLLLLIWLHIIWLDGKFRGHCVSDTVDDCEIMLLSDGMLALPEQSPPA